MQRGVDPVLDVSKYGAARFQCRGFGQPCEAGQNSTIAAGIQNETRTQRAPLTVWTHQRESGTLSIGSEGFDQGFKLDLGAIALCSLDQAIVEIGALDLPCGAGAGSKLVAKIHRRHATAPVKGSTILELEISCFGIPE